MPLASLSPQGMPLRILPLNSLFFGACYCIEKLVINKLVTIKLAIEELAFEELVTVELKFNIDTNDQDEFAGGCGHHASV